jgi:hypothetical protein
MRPHTPGDRQYNLCLSYWYISVLLLVLGPAETNAVERSELEVRETVGLARGGYPAHALLKLPRPVSATTSFRLLYEGKPVVAQFRPDGDKETAKWWLDFQTEIKPHEKKQYILEFGEDVAAGPQRPQGHKLAKGDKSFSIANTPYITWTVPHDLKGLLQSVDFAPSEFLSAGSPGLLLRDRQSREYPFSGTGRVIRQGPMAVALRFEKAESQERLRDVRSTVDLTFPAPVSWVEVEWNIDDPHDNVAAIGLQLDLNVEKSNSAATLVDFGATSVVYTSLRTGQEAELLAGTRAMSRDADDALWKVLRGDKGRLAPFALGLKRLNAGRVEGWSHIMDRKICLALALDAFARDTRDRIRVAADGRVTVWREYDLTAKASQKRLRLWLHFVHFPPQASAGASPQQMQSPLEIRQLEP